MYNIVNFYKLELMNNYLHDYDEVLYLDFDAIPVTKDNFFDAWDLSKGIAVYNNNNNIRPTHMPLDMVKGTIRSPSAKYFNTMAMVEENGYSPQCDVINTGIIGINREHLEKLNYFGKFEDDLTLMTQLAIQTKKVEYWDENAQRSVWLEDGDKVVTNIFPEKIRQYFGWDNETLFSFKLKENNVPVQWLDDKWHYFLANQGFIPKETILCHTINKDFDLVWRRINA